MIIFDQKFKDELYTEAASSLRQRSHVNVHTSYNDKVQRLAIALIHGTYIPPHMHEMPHQWEFFHVIDGEVKLIIFDGDGCISNIVLLGAAHQNFAVQIAPGTFHTLVSLSEKAFIFEWKEGPFDPIYAKVLPDWSVSEEGADVKNYVRFLESATIGNRFRFK